MSLKDKIKAFFTKTKADVATVETDVIKFFTEHSSTVVGLMAIMDGFYDNNNGPDKMKSVIKIAIMAINNKFKSKINPDDESSEIVAILEKEFQNIYNTLYKVSQT